MGGVEKTWNDCINGRLFSDIKETRENSSDVGGGREAKGQEGERSTGASGWDGRRQESVRRLDEWRDTDSRGEEAQQFCEWELLERLPPLSCRKSANSTLTMKTGFPPWLVLRHFILLQWLTASRAIVMDSVSVSSTCDRFGRICIVRYQRTVPSVRMDRKCILYLSQNRAKKVSGVMQRPCKAPCVSVAFILLTHALILSIFLIVFLLTTVKGPILHQFSKMYFYPWLEWRSLAQIIIPKT